MIASPLDRDLDILAISSIKKVLRWLLLMNFGILTADHIPKTNVPITPKAQTNSISAISQMDIAHSATKPIPLPIQPHIVDLRYSLILFSSDWYSSILHCGQIPLWLLYAEQLAHIALPHFLHVAIASTSGCIKHFIVFSLLSSSFVIVGNDSLLFYDIKSYKTCQVLFDLIWLY